MVNNTSVINIGNYEVDYLTGGLVIAILVLGVALAVSILRKKKTEQKLPAPPPIENLPPLAKDYIEHYESKGLEFDSWVKAEIKHIGLEQKRISNEVETLKKEFLELETLRLRLCKYNGLPK